MSTPRPSISPLSNAFESTKNSPSLVRTGAVNETIQGGALVDDDKDDSSLLSEPEDDEDEEDALDTILRRDDVDSEAETERLELTPRHARDMTGIGRTPSKLSKVEPPDDELSDVPSPLPMDVGAASSTSTFANGGKKRKRSNELDSPLTSEASLDGQLPRKRVNSFGEVVSEETSRDEAVDGDDTTKKSKVKAKTKRGRQLRDEETVDSTADLEEEVVEPELEEAVVVPEDTPEQSEAMDAFGELAKQFTAFRDALYNERLASIEAELALLEQPQCQHPEYLRMVACVQQRRVKQDRETRAFHHYREIATQQKIMAERAQMHSQYFQTVREIRETVLDTLGTAWCSIQRERRSGPEELDEEDLRHVYRYVDKRGDLLRQQAKYNREVSILAGVAKYVGFPAAPKIAGIEGEKMDQDLRAMKILRPVQVHHHNTKPYMPQTSTPAMNPYVQRQTDIAATSERSAHDRFIEQNAWARAPQSANHTSLTSTPNISHTPEWAGFRKPSSHLLKDHVGGSPAMTPVGTPLMARKELPNPEHDNRPALPESSPLQVPKQRVNGAESNGWRNYSGTSTIDAPLDSSVLEPEPARRDFGDTPGTQRIPTAMFPSERPDVFRSAGFRPLEATYTMPAFGNPGGG